MISPKTIRLVHPHLDNVTSEGVIIHELGHYIIAKILKFNVVKIIIYPYGGLVKIEDNINKSSNDELLVASSGVVFQSLYYLLFMFLAKYNFFNDYTISLFKSYHFSILFFNILPIINLDGFKILNIILNKCEKLLLFTELDVII